MSNYVHESSYLGKNVTIGDNTKVWYFTHISDDAEIGDDCNIGQNVFVDRGVKIGDKVKIQNNVSVYKGVEVSDKVFLGPSCVFTNVINPRSFIERKHEIKKTIVGTGATIGANATIVCGVTIGSYAMIGAGAVVTRDIPDYALVRGLPSRVSGYVCECGVKLNNKDSQYLCPDCGQRYKMTDSGLRKDEL